MEINWEAKVLSSLVPVIENSEEVIINNDEIKNVARWMAYEEFILPQNNKLRKDPEDFIRTTFLINTLNFAFTDFKTSVKYSIERDGEIFSDSEAMFKQIHEAIDSGKNLLDGEVLANLTIEDLGKIFSGNIEMPMMEERVEALNSVGVKLSSNFEGDWMNFINAGPKRLYKDGEGLIERLLEEFPRFNDKSIYKDTYEVHFYKLAQLAFWGIHAELSGSKYFVIEDMNSMSAFADYIIPVALEVMKITEYSENLKAKILEGMIIERDSQEEIEIRAASLFATAKLTEEINKRRNKDDQLIIPQLDYRIWKQYHATHRPHHLTVTTMY